MGYNNGYESGYSDALEDVRNGKVAGIGPSGGEARKRYSVVRVAGGDPNDGPDFSDEDVLSVTMEDLGVDSTSSGSQTMDFNRIADKLAPVVVFDVFWNLSANSLSVQGPEGYYWDYLAHNFSPGGSLHVALAASGTTYVPQ